MHALSLGPSKCQKFFLRMWSKSCYRLCRVQKIPVSLNQEKSGAKKKWWIRGLESIFGKYLFFTNTISSGMLMALGDMIQQEIEYLRIGKHSDSFEWHRMKNMGAVGAIQGPLAHFFYKLLDSNFPGKKVKTIVKKVFLDQIIASPLFISLFFGTMNYLENKTFEETKTEIRDKFLLVYSVDCSVWIPAQILNFYCVSSVYRVIYINLLTMCYNVFLSFVKHDHHVMD